VEGLAYLLESVEIDGEAIEQEIGMNCRDLTYGIIRLSFKSSEQDGPSDGVVYIFCERCLQERIA
jgi:hypothetical protein